MAGKILLQPLSETEQKIAAKIIDGLSRASYFWMEQKSWGFLELLWRSLLLYDVTVAYPTRSGIPDLVKTAGSLNLADFVDFRKAILQGSKGLQGRLAALIFASETNSRAVLRAQVPAVKEVLRTVSDQGFISGKKIVKILETFPRMVTSGTWGSIEATTELGFYDIATKLLAFSPSGNSEYISERSSYNYQEGVNFYEDSLFTIPTRFFGQTRLSLNPELFTGKENPVEQLPQGDDGPLTVFSGEESLLKAAPMLLKQFPDYKEEYKSSGTLLASKARKMAAVAGLPEMFPSLEKDRYMRDFRARAVTGRLYKVYPTSSKVDFQKVLASFRGLMPDARSFLTQQFTLMMPQLKALKGKQIDSLAVTTFIELNNDTVCQLELSSQGKWVPMDTYAAINRRKAPMGVTQLLLPEYFTSGMDLENSYTGEKLNLEQLRHWLEMPALSGYIALLAAIGAVDIAYDEDHLTSDAPLTAIRYYRLTPLGRYFLGLDKTYKVKAVEEQQHYFLEDKSLIIRIDSPEPQHRVLLERIGRPISADRFVVTRGSFLGGASSAEEIEAQIDYFRRYVCQKPPENWTRFFNDLLATAKAVERIPSTDYTIFQVAREDTRLQRLLTSEPALRKLVVLAEDRMFLVPNSNLTKFTNALRTFGFILP